MFALVRENFDITIGKNAILRAIQGSILSLKNANIVPNTANNTENKQRRKKYVEKILALTANRSPIIYDDETNFNMFISRTQGRSVVGK